MKRLSLTILSLLSLLSVSAQVHREVEVTKQYAPALQQSRKLAIVPDEVDTVTIRPEIDYTITPKACSAAFKTEKFRPASVTYWELARKYPFYLKAGVGYPLASELDFYATTQRADVGYLTAFANHLGRFSNIKVSDAAGEVLNNNSQQMVNRVGLGGGKYFGKYTLEGLLNYNASMYSRYTYRPSERVDSPERVDFETMGVNLSFGDQFADLTKLNFAVYLDADFYNDKSDQFYFFNSENNLVSEMKLQQLNFNGGVRFARNIAKKFDFAASLGYQGYYGMQNMEQYSNTMVSASLIFGYHTGSLLELKAGLSYYYDNLALAHAKSVNHLLPYLYVGLNIGSGVFVPYFEVDGNVENNSYCSLQQRNPYIAIMGYEALPTTSTDIALPNTRNYNARLGFMGQINSGKLSYRLYANLSLAKNALYWYCVDRAFFGAETARLDTYSLNAAVEYKPISSLFVAANVKGMIHKKYSDIEVARPALEADVALRYTHRKFAVGVNAALVSSTKWSVVSSNEQSTTASHNLSDITTKSFGTYVDLSLSADWFVSKQCTLFIEGRNLANSDIYRWAFYREYGVGCLLGFKVQF